VPRLPKPGPRSTKLVTRLVGSPSTSRKPVTRSLEVVTRLRKVVTRLRKVVTRYPTPVAYPTSPRRLLARLVNTLTRAVTRCKNSPHQAPRLSRHCADG